MKLNSNFEIVEVADEFLAIPIGKAAEEFHGIVVLSEPAAFILKNMDTEKTRSDLIKLLLERYDVSEMAINQDLDHLIETCKLSGLIVD